MYLSTQTNRHVSQNVSLTIWINQSGCISVQYIVVDHLITPLWIYHWITPYSYITISKCLVLPVTFLSKLYPSQVKCIIVINAEIFMTFIFRHFCTLDIFVKILISTLDSTVDNTKDRLSQIFTFNICTNCNLRKTRLLGTLLGIPPVLLHQCEAVTFDLLECKEKIANILLSSRNISSVLQSYFTLARKDRNTFVGRYLIINQSKK